MQDLFLFFKCPLELYGCCGNTNFIQSFEVVKPLRVVVCVREGAQVGWPASLQVLACLEREPCVFSANQNVALNSVVLLKKNVEFDLSFLFNYCFPDNRARFALGSKT